VKAQGICGVCGATVGVMRGELAAQHNRIVHHWGVRCDGSDQPVDVAAWIARETATALATVDAAEGRRQRARADYDADLARITVSVAEADETLRGLAALTAKRGRR